MFSSIWGGGQTEDKFGDAAEKLFDGAQAPAGNEPWWEDLWKTPASAEDIWEEFAPDGLRRLKRERPETVAMLVFKLVGALESKAHETALKTDKDRQEATSLVRLLTCILPFLFEVIQQDELCHLGEDKIAQEANTRFLDQMFWVERPQNLYKSADLAVDDDTSKGTSTDDLDVEFALSLSKNGKSTSTQTPQADSSAKSATAVERTESSVDKSTHRPLAARLLDAVLGLMFVRGYTVPATADDNVFDKIWASGIGCEKAEVANAAMDATRVEVLELLLVCLSEGLYRTLAEYRPSANKWLTTFVLRKNDEITFTFFVSLLNTVCQYDPVGYGIPYNYILLGDSKEPLTVTCLHVLLLLLDHTTTTPTISSHSTTENGGQTQEEEGNVFIRYVLNITEKDSMDFVADSIIDLLRNPLTKGYLPGSSNHITFTSQLMLLTWRLLDYNKLMLQFIVNGALGLQLLEPVLVFALEARQDIAKLGTVHIATFILLLLSGERTFGVSLNETFTGRLADIPSFSGHYGDLLILSIHKLITQGHPALSVTFDNFLTVICNVTPYLKSVSKTAVAKLLALFEAFAKPTYLCAGPHNPNRAYFLLECFNNLVQYQFAGSTHLVYGVLRRRAVFEQLNALSEPPAILMEKKFKDLVPSSPQQAKEESTAEDAAPSTSTQDAPAGGETPENKPENENTDPSRRVDNAVVHEKTVEQSDQPNPEQQQKAEEKWAPTAEWIASWKQVLPLQTCLSLIEGMAPQVEEMCAREDVSDEHSVMEFLRNGTLVGLLPVPHPITVRKYNSVARTFVWLSAYLWGMIYLRHSSPPLWRNTTVSLFEVRLES
eukprot:comp22978_c1_seq1/m.36551 comp22978_c1_seq1/g.36551  ORF comp22978_c1_seq1/g.36551 comp22978_c1_seq1/m.36551 type:complete len:832 (-) comp22978_c1_seq1:91-2586(-)